MIKSKEWEQIKILYSYSKQHEPPKKWFYGIEGIEFIFHNTWNDPEIKYKEQLFNAEETEDYFWKDFLEMKEEDGETDTIENHERLENEFATWMKNNAEEIRLYLDNKILNRA